MKKLIALAIASIISTNVFAECSVSIMVKDEEIPGDMPAHIYGRHDYNITNKTSSRQLYQVCHELSTQRYNHTDKFTNAYCENVILSPGQSTGTIKQGITLNLRYPHMSSGWYHVSLDSIMEIHGECQTQMHRIRNVKVV
jgi:hypothetical protein